MPASVLFSASRQIYQRRLGNSTARCGYIPLSLLVIAVLCRTSTVQLASARGPLRRVIGRFARPGLATPAIDMSCIFEFSRSSATIHTLIPPHMSPQAQDAGIRPLAGW